MPAAKDESVAREQSPAPDALTAEFDHLLMRMQTPEAEAALRDAFNASPDELGRAAAAAATHPE